MLRQLATLRSPAVWPRAGADVGWGVLGVVLCWLGAQVFSVFWGSAVAAVTGRSLGDAVDPNEPFRALFLSALGLWLAYLAAPFVAARIAGGNPLADYELRTPPSLLLLGGAVGIGTHFIILPVLYWPILKLVDADPDAYATELLDRVDGPLDLLLMISGIVVIGPLAEEWFYRGMLLPATVRWVGPLGGAIGSSLAFALLHDAITIPGIFVFALLMSWLVLRTGRIGVAIAAHVVFNATTVVRFLLAA